MDDNRIDLSSLDPTRDQARFDRLVGSIMGEAASELEARKGARNTLTLLVSWKRPMLAAAGLVAVVSCGILWRVQAPEQIAEEIGVAEAFGIPSLLAEGIRANDMPTTFELFEAFQEIP